MAIVNDLVPPSAVSSATALNFLHMNVGRIIGGLVSGLILAAASTSLAFFVAAVLFAVPVAILFLVRTREGRPREDRGEHAGSSVRSWRRSATRSATRPLAC